MTGDVIDFLMLNVTSHPVCNKSKILSEKGQIFWIA